MWRIVRIARIANIVKIVRIANIAKFTKIAEISKFEEDNISNGFLEGPVCHSGFKRLN